MPVKETEYYDILELESTCTPTDIKKSYRRLCLVHHPDKQQSTSTSGAPTDHSKFQAIQNAYEVLSDPDRRATYDSFGKTGEKRGERAGGMTEDDDLFAEDFFESMFGSSFGASDRPSRRSERKERGPKHGPAPPKMQTLTVTLEELYNGVEKKVEITRDHPCRHCQGTGARPNTKRRTCSKCEGRGLVFVLRHMGAFVQRMQLTCPDCEGEGSRYRVQDLCAKCHGSQVLHQKKQRTVTIPRGTNVDETLILKGEGNKVARYTEAGDLHFDLKVLAHPTFILLRAPSAVPQNLQTTLSITLSEALLGFSRLILIHLDGRGLRVTQPAPGQKGWRCLKTNDRVLIRGEGMFDKGGRKGDLVLVIDVEMPDEHWASERRSDDLLGLEALLPPKRPDLHHSSQTDTVTLESPGSKV